MDTLPALLLWSFAFIFSTTVHEAAHAFMAWRLGDATAYHAGQVTLNPWPHIRREPLGMVIVPVVMFALNGWMVGWASTPISAIWADRFPRKAAWTSLAGPASNLLLILLAVAALRLGMVLGVPGFPPTHDDSTVGFLVALLLTIMILLNAILFVFNLIPLPPLDGAEVLLLFVPERDAHKVREKLRQLGIFGLLIAFFVFPRIIHWVLVPLEYLVGFPLT